MSIGTKTPSTIRDLAQRLEQDIRCRGLLEGDRYLSTIEAGRMLGVSPATAHRALKILTASQSLVRRPNSGTFVGPTIGARPATIIRTVYLLIDASYAEQAYRFDLVAQGIRKEMGDVNIQLSFIPVHNAAHYVTELINAASSTGEVAGVLPMSCGREVYRVLAYSGLPAVVMGSLYLGDPVLPSIDMDNHEAGKLLIHYLYGRGHRRIAMLPWPELRPGDNDRFAGISHAMTALRLPHNALIVHSTPQEHDALTAVTDELLSAPERPTGFIVWSKTAADAVTSAATRMGLRVPHDIEVVYFDHASEADDHVVHTCVRPQMRFELIGSLAGKMLLQLSRREALQQDRVVLPVQLIEVR